MIDETPVMHLHCKAMNQRTAPVACLCVHCVAFVLCLDINECASSPCVNGGSCVDGVNGYTCSCVAGYTGLLCETGKDVKLVDYY